MSGRPSVSVNGPHGRYARLRGTQSELVRFLRRGEWLGPVDALAGRVGRPESNVWLAIAGLEGRGFLVTRRAAAGALRLRLTVAGRRIRL